MRERAMRRKRFLNQGVRDTVNLGVEPELTPVRKMAEVLSQL